MNTNRPGKKGYGGCDCLLCKVQTGKVVQGGKRKEK